MIKFRRFIQVLFTFFMSVQCLKGQQTFHVSIQIPGSFAGKNFLVTYDNGLRIITVTDSFANNKLNFSGIFYSKFAVLKITHTSGDSISNSDEYFIGVKPAKIIFLENSDMSTDGNFKHYESKNAIEIHQSKINRQRIEFSKNEISDMIRFYGKNIDSIWRVDSLKTLFSKKLYDLDNKGLDFIKKHRNDYFSFWWFRTQIIPNTFRNENASIIDFQNLLNFYNTVFSYSYKKSLEGKNISKLLTGRIYTKKTHKAWDFKVKDIAGNLIKLNDFKGKYVLLDFWATWCGPCMQQLPFVKKIREDYPIDKLVMISISSDVNYNKFDSVIKKNKMNWIHIFGDDLLKIYGINAIPAIILIDKNGAIIYDGKNEDNDDLVRLLKMM